MPVVKKLELPEIASCYTLSDLHEDDYDNGALQVLSQLTTVGEVSREDFNKFVKLQQGEEYNTIVVRDADKKVCGISTLLIETKLIHGFSKVGHIEDVAVDDEKRGSNLGLYMVRYLCNMGIEKGCYKVILDCDAKNVVFYEKCGLVKAGIEMEYR